MFNLNSSFFRFITNIGNIIIVSVLWAICCLPVITIIPSTAALYYTCVKVIRHSRGYIIKDFFHSFRMNIKQGIFITILAIVFGLVLYIDYTYIVRLNPIPYYLIVIYRSALTLYVCLLIFLTINLSRFQISFLSLLKLSFFMMIRHFYLSFIMLVLLIAAGILLSAIPITLMFLPGLYILLTSLVMENILKKYMPHTLEDSESDTWYHED